MADVLKVAFETDPTIQKDIKTKPFLFLFLTFVINCSSTPAAAATAADDDDCVVLCLLLGEHRFKESNFGFLTGIMAVIRLVQSSHRAPHSFSGGVLVLHLIYT
jgi:hypothetical protein